VKRFLGSSFGSALLGGAVVALFGLLAIGAGWIEAGDEGGSTVTVARALTPVASSEGEAEANPINRIYRSAERGIAFVETKLGESGTSSFSPFGAPGGQGTASGSGFLIDTEGHIITNSHVVEGAEEVEVALGPAEDRYDAEVVGTDPATDVALLDVDAPAEELHPLALGDSSQLEVGEPVVAIGNPFGLERTVTAGIVSALQRQIQAPNGFSISHVIQTDAAINPGNSGGPLIDASGSVIGINSQIQTGGGQGNVGIGFAVPINTARDVVRQLQDDGTVEHAYLGISGGSITADLAEALDLPVDSGVLINEVVEGGPADEAGVRGGDSSATIEGANIKVGGDILLAVDGKDVSDMEEVIDAVDAAEPGDEMELTVRRGEETKTISVTLGVRPNFVEDTQSGPVGPPAK
jgi:S1-C subfamily serine protease